MNKTLLEKLEFAIRVAEKMIADFEKRKNDAVEKERWRIASDLATYIDGMNQMLVLFQQLPPSPEPAPAVTFSTGDVTYSDQPESEQINEDGSLRF